MSPNRSKLLFLIALACLLFAAASCGQFFRGPTDLIGLSIAPSNSSIMPGNTLQFTATGTLGGGGTGDVTPTVSWTSSNTALATINSTGLATGISYGQVTIAASKEGYTAKTGLSVSNQTITLVSIAVTPANPTVNVGRTQQFVATGTYSNNTTQILTNTATWSSSDTTIATITSNSGLATAVAVGNTTITATSGSISGNTTMTVQ